MYYLSFVQDDWQVIPKNNPLSCHFTTREEEFFEIGMVSSIKVSMVGLMMLFLSRSDPLVPKFPPFMLDVREVVDSPAESSKCVATQIRQEPEAHVQNRRNGTMRF
jgi:hypothetical protein